MDFNFLITRFCTYKQASTQSLLPTRVYSLCWCARVYWMWMSERVSECVCVWALVISNGYKLWHLDRGNTKRTPGQTNTTNENLLWLFLWARRKKAAIPYIKKPIKADTDNNNKTTTGKTVTTTLVSKVSNKNCKCQWRQQHPHQHHHHYRKYAHWHRHTHTQTLKGSPMFANNFEPKPNNTTIITQQSTSRSNK